MISRKFVLCFATTVVLIAAATVSAQEHGCGTVIPPKQISFEREQISGRVDFSQMALAPQEVSIPLTIHILRDGSGSGGLSPESLDSTMTDLNAMYVPMEITFYQCGPVDYIDDDGFYADMSTMARIDSLRLINLVYGTINVYFVPESSGFPYCGISAFSGSAVQSIMMNNLCTGTTSPSTLAHEIGHYFNLYHTHETAFGVECPDGGNCGSSGDLLCDTPADPDLYDHVSDYPYCEYDHYASTPSGCGGTYNPQVDNLMSYSRKNCRDFWSSMQMARLIYMMDNYRPELFDGCTPRLRYAGQTTIDAGGDGDGLTEAGEIIDLSLTIENIGPVTTDAGGLISTSDPYLEITTPSALFDDTVDIGHHAISQTPFTLSVDAGCPDPYVAQLNLDISAEGGPVASEPFFLFVGSTPGFADGAESGDEGWRHYAGIYGTVDGWHIETYRRHSGSYSWKMGGAGSADYANRSDGALVTPPFLLRAGSQLTFWHFIEAEVQDETYAFDGGYVMISTGDGNWTQIHPVGGYPYTAVYFPGSPLMSGTSCYSGTQDWQEATFDLSAYSGVVQVMFRFASDTYTTGEGWYIDDIDVHSDYCCGTYTGGITGNANCSEDGKLTLSDISIMIDRVYISKALLCCEANGNTNADTECKITLSDISRLIDAVFVSKMPPSGCMTECEI